jgi:hypothetical protein
MRGASNRAATVMYRRPCAGKHGKTYVEGASPAHDLFASPQTIASGFPCDLGAIFPDADHRFRELI